MFFVQLASYIAILILNVACTIHLTNVGHMQDMSGNVATRNVTYIASYMLGSHMCIAMLKYIEFPV